MKKESSEDYPEEIRYESWPKDHLKPLIYSYLQQEHPVDEENLINCRDVTHHRESQELAQQYLPEVQLVGQFLREEKKSRSWFGILYRVLINDQEEVKSSRLTIQCIISLMKSCLCFGTLILKQN